MEADDAAELCLDGSWTILCLIFAAVGWLERTTLVCAIPAVCRRWRDVCRSHLLRVDVQLQMLERDAEAVPAFAATVQAVVGRFRSTRRLGLALRWDVPDEGVAAVVLGRGTTTTLDDLPGAAPASWPAHSLARSTLFFFFEVSV